MFETAPSAPAIPITFVAKSTWDAIQATLPHPARQFALANGFAAKPGAWLALPDADGRIAQVLFGLDDAGSKFRDPFRPGALPGLLPPGVYRFANAPQDARLAVDVRDRAAAYGGVGETRIEGHQPLATIERNLMQVLRAHGSVLDRELTAATRAVVDHRERVSAHPAGRDGCGRDKRSP